MIKKGVIKEDDDDRMDRLLRELLKTEQIWALPLPEMQSEDGKGGQGHHYPELVARQALG